MAETDATACVVDTSSFVFFMTNFTVYESKPYVFGVTAEGRTVGLRASHMPYAVYLEHAHDSHDETKSRAWLQSRMRPFLDRQDRRSQYFRPAIQLMQRRKLCGHQEQQIWCVKVLYDNAADARRDAYDIRHKFLACRVYHESLDPNLVFTAHTGLRAFMWVRCDFPSFSGSSTRCDVELCCDVKRLVPAYDETDVVRNLPPRLRIAAFDIETDGLKWENGDEIRMVSVSCDGRDFLLTRHPLLASSPQQYCVVDCADEKDLIAKFVDVVKELRPVFLTGWNIFGFDLQFIFERASLLHATKKIEELSWLAIKAVKPVLKEMNSNAFGQNKIYHDSLEGVITLDGYILARKGTKMPSYSLKAFGEWVGEAKGDVTYEEMVEAFTTKDPALMRNVADYCVQDSRLVLKILARMEEPEKVMAMTRLAAVPPMYAIKRGQSILTFGLILAETFRRGWVVNPPAKPKGAQEGYQGATVIDPVRGYHKDPVAVLDFESLYPSIMQAFNICISTYIHTYAKAEQVPEAYVFPAYSVIEIDDGARVVFQREGEEGVFPSILRVLLGCRKDVKKQMRQWAAGSTEYNQANAKQLSLKVAANSLYGYLGSPVSHLYNKDLAASVTSMGRQSLFQVRHVIQGLCASGKIPPQVHVVYGDSVTGDTPLVLRIGKKVTIQNMRDLDGSWVPYRGTKEAFVPARPWFVWQDGGFTKIRRVIRHLTTKTILRVMTPCGMVDCTEDHSLLRGNGQKVSPNAVNLGDALLHAHDDALLLKAMCGSSVVDENEAFAHGIYDDFCENILGASVDVVQAYWEGLGHHEDRCYTKKMATFVMLVARRLGMRYRLRIFDERSDAVCLSPCFLGTSEVEYIGLISSSYNGYVYDLETQSHHFGVGPGSLVVHNTDSVMVKFPDLTPPEANELATFIERECTQTFTKPLRLEFENLFVTYLLENKKRYAGRVWSAVPGEKPVDVVKGLCVKRRDFPKIVQDGLSGILGILLEGGDDAPTQALAFIEKILEKIGTNQVSVEDLCITKELNKGIHAYKTPPPHLVVSRKMAQRNPHNPPKSGDRITFVVMYGKGNISDRAEAYDHVVNTTKFDLEYYASQLASQCENMMTLCGQEAAFRRLVQKYTTMAKLYCDGQHKLSHFFSPKTTTDVTAPTAAAAAAAALVPDPDTKSNDEHKQPPKKKQQTSLHKWFAKKEV